MDLLVLHLGLLSLFNNNLMVSGAIGNAFRGIRIDIQDFIVTRTVTKSMSLIVCGAQFSVARETGDLIGGANGFHFDEEDRECQIGKVAFPVQEDQNGGIKVYGISKLFS